MVWQSGWMGTASMGPVSASGGFVNTVGYLGIESWGASAVGMGHDRGEDSGMHLCFLCMMTVVQPYAHNNVRRRERTEELPEVSYWFVPVPPHEYQAHLRDS